MKKFLCMTMLMLAALTVSAGGSDEGPKPPEQDIGPRTDNVPRTENPCAPIDLNSNRTASVIPGAVADGF